MSQLEHATCSVKSLQKLRLGRYFLRPNQNRRLLLRGISVELLPPAPPHLRLL
jgi:hypothetical protein